MLLSIAVLVFTVYGVICRCSGWLWMALPAKCDVIALRGTVRFIGGEAVLSVGSMAD